jgi:eukaryotic-like serine/threonine-protein kinase
MTAMVGSVVAGRFALQASLGAGSMGEVFRAHDSTLGELVALKSVVLRGTDAGATLRRFREEVRLARRVTHKNVARVFDLVEDDGGAVFLTMELIDGMTLKDLLASGRGLAAAEAIRIGIAVCDGLGAVHEAGVVHRDLKPSNILLGESGRVVITDFGVARSLLDPASVALGSVVGTPMYMAPEQAAGMPVGFAADVYALGVTLLELLTGRAPRSARDAEPFTHDVDPRLARVLLSCLADEPGARPSPGLVQGALAACATTATDGPSTKSAPIQTAPASVLAVDATKPGAERVVTTADADVGIIVMPLRELGSSDGQGLGEVVAGELSDVLSVTRGLRVVSTSAASRFRDDRDPLRIGRELGVHAIVDGTLRVSGAEMRMTVRLIDARSGSQLWAESLNGTLADLFSFESLVAKRVAEQLRVRVALIDFGSVGPAEAVRAYLDARAIFKTPAGLAEALPLLERALALAPTFRPAIAAYAMTSMLAWFVPFFPTSDDWEERCAERIARALATAPGLAETHVAHGMLEWERGHIAEGASSLRHALRLAPTCGDALMWLGELECRMGEVSSGIAHARLSWELDPTRFPSLVTLAREELFAGRREQGIALLDSLGDLYSPPAFLLRVRAAAWARDEGAIRAALGRAWTLMDVHGAVPVGDFVARAFLGEVDTETIGTFVDHLLSNRKSPRIASEILMTAVEVDVSAGRLASAERLLERLMAIGAFVDVDWLTRCPGLAPLRDRDVMTAALDLARGRIRVSEV